jgi:hypothetical protein
VGHSRSGIALPHGYLIRRRKLDPHREELSEKYPLRSTIRGPDGNEVRGVPGSIPGLQMSKLSHPFTSA